MSNHQKVPDQELLKQIKRGNQTAFRELYNRYWEKLFFFGLDMLHDEDATKDVVQDVFCKIWENRKDQDISNTNAYLMQSVRYASLKHLKVNSLKQCDLNFLVNEPSVNHVEEMINFNETNKKLRKLIDKLPNQSRKVFYLSRYSHLSNDQIAEQLNISKSTVEWHISKALKFLRLAICDVLLILWIVSLTNI